jgi:hypothetical protein
MLYQPRLDQVPLFLDQLYAGVGGVATWARTHETRLVPCVALPGGVRERHLPHQPGVALTRIRMAITDHDVADRSRPVHHLLPN